MCHLLQCQAKALHCRHRDFKQVNALSASSVAAGDDACGLPVVVQGNTGVNAPDFVDVRDEETHHCYLCHSMRVDDVL
eukprot:CAMPEP_0194755224 /NCGR_PEP_ID=MMETSP0323_2-20130528/9115_1 /TAXON_ID=2866 ORGANISM="Crypthecodinium cohnii, Strain Seligo" /NCGR_SAMPLE_ID=MMETSP0323_2 /ASSEMBLY_ACC=CAM_ASM_000346 /LENGTH=77 /DNA_ID=CAMNT_0039674173 /DNA_START=403 /DNA_END=636 /DNA_ORIENTATION=-